MGKYAPYIRIFLRGFGIFLICYLVFFLMMFPTSEIGGLVTSQVAQMTGNQVVIEFEDMSFMPLPSVSTTFDDFYLQMSGGMDLKADRLSLSMSPFGLMGLAMSMPDSSDPKSNDLLFESIAKNLSADVEAQGIFSGDVLMSASPEGKSKDGDPLQSISLNISKISLQKILKQSKIEFPLKAKLTAKSQLSVDLQFKQQPEGEVELVLKGLRIPPEEVQTPAGPLVLPDIKISEIKAKGRLSNGSFLFEEISLGKNKEGLKGKIKGDLALQIRKQGTRFIPILGAYSFDIDIDLSQKLHDEAAILFLLVNKYQSEAGNRIAYKFRVQGTSFQSPPRFSNIR